MSDLDKKVKEDVYKRTTHETYGMQDEIWGKLDKVLFNHKKKEVKKKNRFVPLGITIAASLFLLFSLQTNTGSALIKGIKDMFTPEKEMIQGIEGNDEETMVQLNEGSGSEYIIYIDETRYKMIPGEDMDAIRTLEPLPEDYPEVSLTIKQVPNELPEELATKLETELKKDFPELKEVETVTEPVAGFLLHGVQGYEWDSKVVHAYVISNGREGSFIITGNYFLEASEGHGARFHYMLETFEIVE
ncbi:hypothetical protein ACXYMX_13515 [Sporosarcina sp. CAU 1771]